MTPQEEIYSRLVTNPVRLNSIMKEALIKGCGWLQHGAVFRDSSGIAVKCNISPDGEYWYTTLDGRYFRGRLNPVEFLFFDELPVGVEVL